jgi:hypothetical protein
VLGTGVAVGRVYYDRFRLDQSQPGIARAESERTTARNYDEQWSTIEQAGSDDRDRIRSIQALQQGRDVQAGLLTEIAAALPPPTRGMMEGNVAEVTRTPRPQRNVLAVDSYDAEYRPDVGPILAMSD